MQPRADQNVVRQHERFTCRLASSVRVASKDAEQVTLARSVSDNSGAVSVFITDASRGGLGAESSVFFPRGCHLTVRILGAPEPGDRELLVRVQRVTMINRKPTYYLGLSFMAKGAEHDRSVAAILEFTRLETALINQGQPGREASR